MINIFEKNGNFFIQTFTNRIFLLLVEYITRTLYRNNNNNTLLCLYYRILHIVLFHCTYAIFEVYKTNISVTPRYKCCGDDGTVYDEG